jgi:hypothetical protein
VLGLSCWVLSGHPLQRWSVYGEDWGLGGEDSSAVSDLMGMYYTYQHVSTDDHRTQELSHTDLVVPVVSVVSVVDWRLTRGVLSWHQQHQCVKSYVFQPSDADKSKADQRGGNGDSGFLRGCRWGMIGPWKITAGEEGVESCVHLTDVVYHSCGSKRMWTQGKVIILSLRPEIYQQTHAWKVADHLPSAALLLVREA